MKERPYTDFYASFLGGFSLFYQGERVSLSKRIRQKNMQLLLILLMAGKKGIHRSQLIGYLGDESADDANQLVNLRYCAFSLRKLIQETKGFPEGRYAVYRKGMYYFSQEYELETDVGRIDAMYRRIRDGTVQGEERLQLLMDLCQIYGGEFLPTLTGEEWATVEGARYQRIYTECMNDLCKALKEKREYTLLLELCTQASRIYPYDNWQSCQIDCLIAQNRYEDARRVYETANAGLYEEMGISMPAREEIWRRDESQGSLWSKDALTEIKVRLKEKETGSGAYWCSYPSFVDIYRVVTRIKERTRENAVLLLCTLTDPAERIPEDKEYTLRRMEQLKKLLSGAIRSNDVCARYSVSQFVALLVNTSQTDGRGIARRLKEMWEAEDTGEVALQTEISPDSEEGQGQQRKWKREVWYSEAEAFIPDPCAGAAECNLARLRDLDGGKQDGKFPEPSGAY